MKFDEWARGLDILEPFQSKTRKRFTREEIKEHILGMKSLDPQPNGKNLSKRAKAENALHDQIAAYFDEPKGQSSSVPF